MEEDETNLEILLARAANPLNKELDLEAVSAFCNQIATDHEGPQTALRFLAHRIQSPQEKEALMALLVLEECVERCGARFLNEVGKFRFLNELIKVVSPKYLGVKAPLRVKEKVLELLFKWSMELKHEAKIHEAYQMLKKQGVVKEDPVHVLKNFDPAPPLPPRAPSVVFEDRENSQLLQKLLQSRNPQDLQAANRLIKNMVKEADRRMELMARTATELEAVHNNAAVLSDMLNNYKSGQTSEEEKELMKELYESCERLRPKLFRLAGELDEKDKGLDDILKANDELTAVIALYRKKLGIESNDEAMSKAEQTLMDLNSPVQQTNHNDSSLLDDQLLNLGLNDLDLQAVLSEVSGPTNNSTLSDLGQIFSTASLGGLPAVGAVGTVGFARSSVMPPYGVSPLKPSQAVPAKSPISQVAVPPPEPSRQTTNTSRGFEELDVLGQTLLKQSLQPNAPKIEFPSTPQKVPMSQMQKQQVPVPGSPSLQRVVDNSTDIFASSSPSKSSDAFSLADIFVPLESIQPGTLLPLTLHEKNGLTVVIHFGRDSPRPDVTVMVVSSMSKNSSPLKNVKFQAAVPKSMKVKLQPPSATDLPPHNPILPPAAITQVMLLANPSQEKVRLKYRITYSMGDVGHTDIGEVDNLLGGGT